MLQLEFIRIFSLLAYSLIAISLFNFCEVAGNQNSIKKSKKSHSSRGGRYRNKYLSSPTYQSLKLPQEEPKDNVTFVINLSHSWQKDLHIQCDLVKLGNWVKIGENRNHTYTYPLHELNAGNETVRHPWMSCRFVRYMQQAWNSAEDHQWTPPKTTPPQTYGTYLNISLTGTRETNSTSYVYLNDSGIFAGQHSLVSLWGSTNETNISTNPGFKFLISRSGRDCNGLCTKMKDDEPEMCLVRDAEDHQYCIPQKGYDIKKYAYGGILSDFGVPCIGKCEWGSSRNGKGTSGYMCLVRVFIEPMNPISDNGDPQPMQYCSPVPGVSYKGVNCTDSCTFDEEYSRSCTVPDEHYPYRRHRDPCSV